MRYYLTERPFFLWPCMWCKRNTRWVYRDGSWVCSSCIAKLLKTPHTISINAIDDRHLP